MKTERYLDWHLVVGLIGIGLLLAGIAFIGLHYLFLTSTLDTLAWLLSGSLIALPILVGFAFWIGKTEARGALNAMEWTLNTTVRNLGPMEVAATRQWSIMQREVDRQTQQRLARDMMTGLSEAIPQLTSGNGSRQVRGEVVDDGEVSM